MARIPGVHRLSQVVIGTEINAQVTLSNGGPYFIPGGPTVTIVPRATGLYKISVIWSVYTNSTNAFCQIIASSGSPVIVSHGLGLKQPPTGFAPMTLESWVNLIEGQSYTFEIQVDIAGGGFAYFGASMVAEQIV